MSRADDLLSIMESFTSSCNPRSILEFTDYKSTSGVHVSVRVDGGVSKVDLLPVNANSKKALQGMDFKTYVEKKIEPNLPKGFTLKMSNDKAFELYYSKSAQMKAAEFLKSVGLHTSYD
jgi:hypothetical protein